ncbi:MAG: hypothetical protein ACK4VY_02400 [Brevundimonas sp.]
MKSGILQGLADAAGKTATHHDAGFRFWMGVGLLCSLSHQNDYGGVTIAIESVLDFELTGNPGEMDVPIVRDAAGAVTDILHDQADYAGHPWVEAARAIALLPDPEARLVCLEAACLRLVINRDDRLEDVFAELAAERGFFPVLGHDCSIVKAELESGDA